MPPAPEVTVGAGPKPLAGVDADRASPRAWGRRGSAPLGAPRPPFLRPVHPPRLLAKQVIG